MEFAVTASFEGDLQVVATQGDLDVHAAPQLSSILMPLVQPGSVAAAVSAGTVDVENPGSSVSVIYVPDEQTPNVTTVVWVNENGAK